MRTIDVLISSPNAAVRNRLRRAVRSDSELRIVGLTCGDAECLCLLRSLQPETALLHACGDDSQNAPPVAITAAHLATKVLLCERHAGDEKALRATALGFWGCVGLDDADGVLVRAIRAVSRGELWVSRKVLSHAFAEVARGSHRIAHQETAPLTVRETELANWLSLGLSNKEIARHLGISDATVKTHVHRILHKLHARSRVQLGGSVSSNMAAGGRAEYSVMGETSPQLDFDFA